MNPTVHSMRNYVRRFWIELVLFWIVSGALSIVLFREGSAEVISRLKTAEILMALVVVLRLTMAESLLHTTSGWYLRPLAKKNLSCARGILLAVALLPALAFRSWVWVVKSKPDWQDALDLGWSDFLPLGAFIVVTVGVMRLVMKLRAREAGGLWLLPLAPALVALVAMWMADTSFSGSQWSSVPEVRALPRSVAEAMPDGDRRIGPTPWVDGSLPELMARFPLVEGRRDLGGFGCRLEQVRLENKELKFLLSLESADPLPRHDELVFVVRYADGSYSGALRVDGGSFRTRVPFFERYGREIKMRFPSPLSLPWNRLDDGQVLRGAELWVLRMTGEPFFPQRGPLYLDSHKLGLAALELAHADPLAMEWREKDFLIRPEVLLQWPTWSHAVWTRLVLPILRERDISSINDRLLARLKNDVRPAGLMSERNMEGWVVEELTRRLNEGLPLDADAVMVMMRWNGFPTNEQTVHALVSLPDWNDRLGRTAKNAGQEEAFNHLAAQAWQRSGGAAGRAPAARGLAAMAARRGDADALRYLAREGEVQALERLIEPRVDDPVRWLAAHPVIFDPTRRIFIEDRK